MEKPINPPITTWPQFNRIVRSNGRKLLKRLDEFPNSILVTGCQRSGTTILANILTQSPGMTNYGFGRHDELATALILSGYVEHTPKGRYCFQTTYINERYHEYYEHFEVFKMVWVIRNPYSAIYSLMYNWPRPALNAAFMMCAAYQLSGIDKRMYGFWGSRWVSPVRQASLLYRAKTLHLLDLVEKLDGDKIFVVDYDDLVSDKNKVLQQIYRFVELDYKPEYSKKIHNKSIDKKAKLSEREKMVVENLALPIYKKAQLRKSI